MTAITLPVLPEDALQSVWPESGANVVVKFAFLDVVACASLALCMAESMTTAVLLLPK